MSRPYVRKTAPQHFVDTCGACDGEGGTYQWDADSEDPRRVFVECEGCGNCGLVGSCDRCDESMPATEAELLGWICGPCRADLEMSDDSAERARWRRVG